MNFSAHALSFVRFPSLLSFAALPGRGWPGQESQQGFSSAHKRGNNKMCSLKLCSIVRKWAACMLHFHRSGNSAEFGLTPEKKFKSVQGREALRRAISWRPRAPAESESWLATWQWALLEHCWSRVLCTMTLKVPGSKDQGFAETFLPESQKSERHPWEGLGRGRYLFLQNSSKMSAIILTSLA